MRDGFDLPIWARLSQCADNGNLMRLCSNVRQPATIAIQGRTCLRNTIRNRTPSALTPEFDQPDIDIDRGTRETDVDMPREAIEDLRWRLATEEVSS